jgi:hypothetical protein
LRHPAYKQTGIPETSKRRELAERSWSEPEGYSVDWRPSIDSVPSDAGPRNQIFLYLNHTLTEGVPASRKAASMACGTPVVRKSCRRDAATELGVSNERRDALSLK